MVYLGKMADLGQLAAERGKFSAQDAGALVAAFLGEGQGQIAHADAAQADVQQVDRPGEGDASGSGEPARHGADGFHE